MAGLQLCAACNVKGALQLRDFALMTGLATALPLNLFTPLVAFCFGGELPASMFGKLSLPH